MECFKPIAIRAVRSAGNILLSQFGNPGRVKAKAKHDIVSGADLKSEKIILAILKSNFPKHATVAEESGSRNKGSEFVWYVDPLDGTANFVSGNPYFSVSIALARKGKVVLGVVYCPISNELYVAEPGRGAFLNSKRVYVSRIQRLADSLVASAYAAQETNIKKGLRTVAKMSLAARKVLINFSPALDLCNIARGRLDALVDAGTTPEDHAAGSLIVTEAGGRVQNFGSKTWNVGRGGIIASNGAVHSRILELI
jgi:myo-inositol-1(or 4)-monophosphatase